MNESVLAAAAIGLTGIVVMSIAVSHQSKKFWREIERMYDNRNNEQDNIG